MKITLKNLQQQSFVIEMEPTITVCFLWIFFEKIKMFLFQVKQLKEKIEKDAGAEYPSENLKLIYAG